MFYVHSVGAARETKLIEMHEVTNFITKTEIQKPILRQENELSGFKFKVY